jgi:UPF0716 family protein affecting phage T7 exclusion
MPTPSLLPRRLPLGLIGFLLWVALEIALFQLVAGRLGGALTTFLFIAKPVLGALFLGSRLKRLIRRGAGVFRVELGDRQALEALLATLGGLLLVLPGFGAGLAGLALLNGSIRRAIAARFAAPERGPREIDLDPADWRETDARRPRRLRAPRS